MGPRIVTFGGMWQYINKYILGNYHEIIIDKELS